MGTPDYAEAILQKIISTSDMEVVAVYTQPDKPVGRKKIMTPPIVKTLASKNNIKVYQPNRLRDEDVVKELQKIECDFIIVAAYGQILPKEILDHAPCINLHASILPKYRGASPIQQTLLNGDTQTGVTAMMMDVGLDTGDIIKIETIDVPCDMMLSTLFDKLTEVASALTIDVLENFSSYSTCRQDETQMTHCTKITKQDGLVEFKDALELYNKYRAFTPWPGVYLESGLKLKEISLLDTNSKNTAGEILHVDKNSIHIACSIGTLRILKVQPQSKKEMDIFSYINGKRLNLADIIS